MIVVVVIICNVVNVVNVVIIVAKIFPNVWAIVVIVSVRVAAIPLCKDVNICVNLNAAIVNVVNLIVVNVYGK